MIIAPLLFSVVVTGIASHGNIKALGKLGAKTLFYFAAATSLALVIGAGAFTGRRGQRRGRRAADWGLSKTSPQTQADDPKTQGRGVAGELVAVVAGACEPP